MLTPALRLPRCSVLLLVLSSACSGDRGADGPQGPVGPQGPMGTPGSPDTAEQILEKLKSIDTVTGGLNAGLLDGKPAAAFSLAGDRALSISTFTGYRLSNAGAYDTGPVLPWPNGGATPARVGYGFTLGPDYVAGSPVTLHVTTRVANPAVSGCFITLDVDRYFHARNGQAFNSGSSTKLPSMEGAMPLAASTTDRAAVFRIVFAPMLTDIQPGDTFSFTLSRDSVADTCNVEMYILGLSVRYTGK